MRIRIGKDIYIKWAILTDGSALPLAERDLVLEMYDPRGVIRVMDFELDNNVLTVYFPGTEQTKVGDYSFTLWENKGEPRQTVVDKLSAFSLVRYSTQEDLTQDHESVDIIVDLGTSSLTTISGATISTLVLNLTGYRSVSSVEELPTAPTTLGYLIGTHLYVYVGEGGNASDGLYYDCGEFRGPQGEQGIQGIQGPRGPQGARGEQGLPGDPINATGIWEAIDHLTPRVYTEAAQAEHEANGTWEEELNKYSLIYVLEG